MAFEIFSLVGRITIDGIEKAEKGLNKHKKTLGDVGRAFQKVGAASLALGTGAVFQAVKFEQQMANVATQLDDLTMKMLPGFRTGITALSKEFGESTAALSKGLFDILSAGIDASDAMEVLEASARSAKAGLTDAGTAADAITTLLNAYGLEAQQAGEVSDFLFSVVRRGKTTFNELAPVIGRVASLAATAGLDMNELGAALATMTKSGIKTEEAVTSLRGVLNTFLSPTTEAKKVSKELGVELNTNTLRTEGLVPVLEKLTKGTDEQIASIFGNIRALSGLSTILKDTNVFYDDLDFVIDKAGKTQEAFAKNTDTTAFRIAQMRQEINASLVVIGDKFLPDINKLINSLIKFSDVIRNLNPQILKLGIIFGALLLPLGTLLVSLPKIVAGFKILSATALFLGTSLSTMTTAMIGLKLSTAAMAATLTIALAIFIKTTQTVIQLIGKIKELKNAQNEENDALDQAADKQKTLNEIVRSGVNIWKQYGDQTAEALIEQGLNIEDAKAGMEGMFALSSQLQGEDRERWRERAEVFKEALGIMETANNEFEEKKKNKAIENNNIIIANDKDKNKKIVEDKKKTDKEIEAADQAKTDKLIGFADRWGSVFEGNIADMLDGSRNFAEGVEDIFNSLGKEVIRIIAKMTAKWIAFAALKGIGNLLTGGLFGGVGSLLGFEKGTDFTVPAGFPGDSFVMPPVGLTSGERVQVTPANQAGRMAAAGGGGREIVLNINMPIENLSLSPENVEDQVEKLVDGIRNGASEAIELVKAINDANTDFQGES